LNLVFTSKTATSTCQERFIHWSKMRSKYWVKCWFRNTGNIRFYFYTVIFF